MLSCTACQRKITVYIWVFFIGMTEWKKCGLTVFFRQKQSTSKQQMFPRCVFFWLFTWKCKWKIYHQNSAFSLAHKDLFLCLGDWYDIDGFISLGKTLFLSEHVVLTSSTLRISDIHIRVHMQTPNNDNKGLLDVPFFSPENSEKKISPTPVASCLSSCMSWLQSELKSFNRSSSCLFATLVAKMFSLASENSFARLEGSEVTYGHVWNAYRPQASDC